MGLNFIIFLVTAVFLAVIVVFMFRKGRHHVKKKKMTKMQHLRKLRLKQSRGRSRRRK